MADLVRMIEGPATAQHVCRMLKEGFWQRQPVVFRNAAGDGFGASQDVLEGLRQLAEQRRPPRIFAGGRLMPHRDAHWCGSMDASLSAYVDRLGRMYRSDDVACVSGGFETTNARIWLGCARFLAALYETVGFPAGDASLNVFVGRYRATPFGFHKDSEDVVTHVVEGTKRYLVWPFDWVEQHMPLPDGAREESLGFADLDYTSMRSSALVLEAHAGDLVYWPWDCFHVAEPADGALTVSLALGVAPFASPFPNADWRAKRALFSAPNGAYRRGAQHDLVEERVELAARVLQDVDVRAAFREELLHRRSRLAFKAPLPPRRAPDAFADDDRLVAPMPGLVVWSREGDRIAVAVNGHGFVADDHPALIDLLKRLDDGETLRVGDVRLEYCDTGELERDELDALLRCLHAFHAFEIEPSADAVALLRARRASQDLFRRPGLHPMRIASDASAILFGEVEQSQHRKIWGFRTEGFRVALPRLLELFAAAGAPRPTTRYVFTLGYCGSTLLCRCIDAMRGCVAISEPKVLDDWAVLYGRLATDASRREWLRVLEMLAVLLARTDAPEGSAVVKAGVHIDAIMRELLSIGDAAGVLLYSPLPTFLGNTLGHERRRASFRRVAQSPLRGRVARDVGLAAIDPFALTDAQCIAFVWLTDLALYRDLVAERPLRALDFDRFLDAPAHGLRRLSDHLELGLVPGGEREIAGSEIFTTYSKSRGDQAIAYDRRRRDDVLTDLMREHAAEIEDALRWARDVWGDDPPSTLPCDLLDDLVADSVTRTG